MQNTAEIISLADFRPANTSKSVDRTPEHGGIELVLIPSEIGKKIETMLNRVDFQKALEIILSVKVIPGVVDESIDAPGFEDKTLQDRIDSLRSLAFSLLAEAYSACKPNSSAFCSSSVWKATCVKLVVNGIEMIEFELDLVLLGVDTYDDIS